MTVVRPSPGVMETEFRAKRAAGRKLLVPYITGQFEQLVGSGLLEEGLTASEEARAKELLGKYSSDGWNLLK